MPTEKEAGKVLWKAGQQAHWELALKRQRTEVGTQDSLKVKRTATGVRKQKWTTREAASMAVIAFFFFSSSFFNFRGREAWARVGVLAAGLIPKCPQRLGMGLGLGQDKAGVMDSIQISYVGGRNPII